MLTLGLVPHWEDRRTHIKLPVRQGREARTGLGTGMGCHQRKQDTAGYDRIKMADKMDGEKFGSGRFDIEQLDEKSDRVKFKVFDKVMLASD